MGNDISITEIVDLDEKRNRQRVTQVFDKLLQDALNGEVRCAVFRLYYKDGKSEVKVIGGTPEEQVAALARLEAEEEKGKTLMEELRPVLDEVFAHLPEDERSWVADSPERMRRALNTLSPERPRSLSISTQERLKKCKILIEQLWPTGELKQI